MLNFFKKWFSKKEKPKEQKNQPLTQIVIMDMALETHYLSEPFKADDDVCEIDWFGETYFHVLGN